jgi:hypothetical protein
MSYYLRYFVDDPQPLTLAQMRTGLQQAGPAVQLSVEGELSAGEDLLAHVEVNAKGTDLFEDEVNQFLRAVAGSPQGAQVERRLRAARVVVAVQVVWQGQPAGAITDLMAPLWSWLQGNRKGLLQADGHGFFDGGHLVLALQ